MATHPAGKRPAKEKDSCVLHLKEKGSLSPFRNLRPLGGGDFFGLGVSATVCWPWTQGLRCIDGFSFALLDPFLFGGHAGSPLAELSSLLPSPQHPTPHDFVMHPCSLVL